MALAGSDRPALVPDRDGTGWTYKVALAINWLLSRAAAAADFDALSLLVSRKTGWGLYQDTAAAQSIATTRTVFTINKGTVIETQKPSDVTTFFDANKITGRNGDAIVVKVQCVFTPDDATASEILFEVDIGGAIGVVESQAFGLVSGAGVGHPISWTFVAYTLGTWAANGGTIYVTCDGPGKLTAKRTVIARAHKAN